MPVTPNEVLQVRESFRLSQEQFAKTVGWGVATVKRYELAEKVPTKMHEVIYKILKNNPQSIWLFFRETKKDMVIPMQERVLNTLKMLDLPIPITTVQEK